jgi:hypothetical protein
MLDSPEGICAGQALFEYPATSVLFSKRLELRFRFAAALHELVQPGPRRVTVRRPYLLMLWLELWVRLADEGCRHAGSTAR